MGFGLIIWDTKRNDSLYDERWTGAKFAYEGDLFDLICKHWTDVISYDAWTDGSPSEYRPANEAEAEAVRAVLRTWPEEHNRDLFLHAVDVVANNPALRFVPSY